MSEDGIEPLKRSSLEFVAVLGLSGLCIGLGIYYIACLALEDAPRPTITHNQFFRVEPVESPVSE